jgi:hypothetical protein
MGDFPPQEIAAAIALALILIAIIVGLVVWSDSLPLERSLMPDQIALDKFNSAIVALLFSARRCWHKTG